MVVLYLATMLNSTVIFQLNIRVVQQRIVLAFAAASASAKNGSIAPTSHDTVGSCIALLLAASMAAASLARTRSKSRVLLQGASARSASGLAAEASRWSAAAVAEEAAALRSRVAAARRVRLDSGAGSVHGATDFVASTGGLGLGLGGGRMGLSRVF